MAGWHHRLNGREFEWTPGYGDGQGGLACCNSWAHKESDTTERLNWTEQQHGRNMGLYQSPGCLQSAKMPKWDFKKYVILYQLLLLKLASKCKKAKWLSGEALQLAVKRREAKSQGEKERFKHLNAEFHVLYSRFLLVIHFKYSSVYLTFPKSLTIPSPSNHTLLL